MTSDLENYIVAVERLEEYADCPKEVIIGFIYIFIAAAYKGLKLSL